jgi:hypothetical protein
MLLLRVRRDQHLTCLQAGNRPDLSGSCPSPHNSLPRPADYFDKRKLVLAFLANVAVASKRIQLVSLSGNYLHIPTLMKD